MEKRTITDFDKEKQEFFKKHDFNYHVFTSDNENNSYIKVYTFEDGAEFYERFAYHEEAMPIEVEVHGLIFNKKVTVKYYTTEYWSSEFASRFVWEKGE